MLGGELPLGSRICYGFLPALLTEFAAMRFVELDGESCLWEELLVTGAEKVCSVGTGTPSEFVTKQPNAGGENPL